MAARSDEPAKRCASPQSLSASAAGRRRASISAKTSIAAERRAAGVMRPPRWRPPSFHRLFQRRSPAGAERFVAANVLADFAGGMTQLAAAKALGHPALVNRDEHAAQQIVRLLGACGDLMGVKVMQPELIDQRLFHLLVKNEKAVGADRARLEFERSRHMPVDVDGLAVLAVAGEIGNVVPAIELDATQD